MITTIVGFAISMAFLFLMLSAACSAIQEIVANLMRWRAKTLQKGLAGLLLSEKFRDEVYNQPLIKGLYAPVKLKKDDQPPAYIPPTTLALAILGAVEKHKLDLSGTPVTPSTSFKETEELLGSLLRDCPTVEEKRKRIESWFNDSMDRVSGWYKRKAHAWIWVFGILLCLGLNADSITLSKRFWTDQPLRDAIVAEATEYVKSNQSGPVVDASKQASATTAADNPNPTPAPLPANEITPDTATKAEAADLHGSIRRLNLLREELPGVPLGWCLLHSETAKSRIETAVEKTAAKATGAQNSPKPVIKVGEQLATCWPDLTHPTAGPVDLSLPATDPRIFKFEDPFAWAWKIVGLIATTLAISQGAPFWFDLLQKAVNLRLAGSPPDAPEPKK